LAKKVIEIGRTVSDPIEVVQLAVEAVKLP
jgi:hypothetical protein